MAQGAKLLGPVSIWVALCACQLITGAGLSQPAPTTAPMATAIPTLPPAATPLSEAQAVPSLVPSSTLVPPEPTATETVAPVAVPALRLLVRAPDSTLQMLDTHLALDPAAAPALNGFLPLGGLAQTTVYAFDFVDQPKVVAVDSGGTRVLDFVQKPNYGLAVWPGDAAAAPRLAWGTQPTDLNTTSLVVSAVDGSQLQTLISEPADKSGPHQLVAERWSADGKSLYFSREPYGIGGYILFAGASSLSRIDVASRKVTDLIPFNTQAGGHMICLDALSADERLVADHCADKVITVRDLTTGQATTLQPPADVAADVGVLGSARFSPDGSRMAFALAKGDASAEQGWVAVSDSLSGASQLVLSGQPGEYFSVVGWLNAQTLLVEEDGLECNPACITTLQAVAVDGSWATKLGDGTFVALANDAQP
jgi:hypothetical protein